MKRGQFGNILLNILFWLVLIGILAWIIKTWVIDPGTHVLGPLDSIKP